MFAIVGPMTIAVKSSQSALYARQQNTAFFLAQEGISIINALRNDNALAVNISTETNAWAWIDSSALAPCRASSGCTIDAVDGTANYWIDPRDTATPDALVDLLLKFYRNEVGLSKASHQLAMKHMTDTTTGPKRIKSVLPDGATLAHKTGTMPGVVNDVGIITSPDGKQHLLLAIVTKGRKVSTTDDVEAVIATTAKKIYDALMISGAASGARSSGGSR